MKPIKYFLGAYALFEKYNTTVCHFMVYQAPSNIAVFRGFEKLLFEGASYLVIESIECFSIFLNFSFYNI